MTRCEIDCDGRRVLYTETILHFDNPDDKDGKGTIAEARRRYARLLSEPGITSASGRMQVVIGKYVQTETRTVYAS